MKRISKDVIRLTVITCMTILLSGAGLLRAQTGTASPAATEPTINRDATLQRAAHLREEAAAHREMEKEFTAGRAASWRERRWNARVVELCRQYAADAETAAAAYEMLAAQDSGSLSKEPMKATEHAIAAPPSTAAEYEARAAEYKLRAAEFRADADRHAAMIPVNPINIQPYRGGGLPQRPVTFESPRGRDFREHCIEIVRRSNDLARDAEDFAKHYALRARQLAARNEKLR
jgi:hypothetical protein